MPRDVYLQPDAPDPILADATVLALVRRHAPDARAVTGVDESGGEARTYAVDSGIILKTQRPHRLRPRTNLEREALFLRHLAGFPDIAVPRVLGHGREGSIEYLCMTRMPGAALARLAIGGAARIAALGASGRVLYRIHRVPQEPLRASGLFPGDRTADDLRARLREAFDDTLDVLRADRQGWQRSEAPADVARRALDGLPETTAFVALHSNPAAEHTFADPLTESYTGTIDFGDAYISHPALDLRRWRDPADRTALLEGYTAEHAVDDSFLAVWRVTQVLADMQAIAGGPAVRPAAYTHLAQIW
jgi:aminoglycoside phosphotransferase